ncbi:MAG: hypothetical protein FWD18_02605 [Micrococcales bacterium]|nr:hypothetical protein [Micrococcales bacterium]
MQNKTNLWIGGTVFAVLAVLGAGWLLAVGPGFEAVSETAARTEQVESQNRALTAQNTTLRRQYEQIDTLKAELARLNDQIPNTISQDTFFAQLGNVATANGVFIGSLGLQPAVSLGSLAAEPAAAPAEGSDVDATVGAAPVAASSGMAIPVTIDMVGSKDAVLATVGWIQGVDHRLFLVTAIDGRGTRDEGPQGGWPGTSRGDMRVLVTGYIFVQPPVAPVTDQTPPSAITGSQLSPG